MVINEPNESSELEPTASEAEQPATDVASPPPAAPEDSALPKSAETQEADADEPRADESTEEAIAEATGDETRTGQLAQLLTRLDDMQSGLAAQLAEIQARADWLTATADQLIRNQEAVPPQMRRMMEKVDDMTTSLSESRLRSILENLLLVHDLLDNMKSSAMDSGDTETADRFGAVLNQILNIFRNNGVTEIETAGAFDPTYHNAVQAVDTNDPEQHELLQSVYRKGFRTKLGILRPSDVAVYKYVPGETNLSDSAAPEPEETASEGEPSSSGPSDSESHK